MYVNSIGESAIWRRQFLSGFRENRKSLFHQQGILPERRLPIGEGADGQDKAYSDGDCTNHTYVIHLSCIAMHMYVCTVCSVCMNLIMYLNMY